MMMVIEWIEMYWAEVLSYLIIGGLSGYVTIALYYDFLDSWKHNK